MAMAFNNANVDANTSRCGGPGLPKWLGNSIVCLVRTGEVFCPDRVSTCIHTNLDQGMLLHHLRAERNLLLHPLVSSYPSLLIIFLISHTFI